MKTTDKIMGILGVIIMIVIIGAALGIPNNVINSIVNWGVSIIIGIILSALAGALVESISGDWLKAIFIVVPIGKLHFSISLFTIATILVKMLLFPVSVQA